MLDINLLRKDLASVIARLQTRKTPRTGRRIVAVRIVGVMAAMMRRIAAVIAGGVMMFPGRIIAVVRGVVTVMRRGRIVADIGRVVMPLLRGIIAACVMMAMLRSTLIAHGVMLCIRHSHDRAR